MKQFFLYTTLLAVLSSCSSFGDAPEGEHLTRISQSKNYNLKKEQFVNPNQDFMDKQSDSVSFWSMLTAPSSDLDYPNKKLPQIRANMEEFLADDSPMKFIWLGHSSFLIRMDSITFLLDPVLSSRASPVWFGGKRFQDPVISLQELPKVDYVVISHDHYDHLDYETVTYLAAQGTRFIIPLGVSSHLIYWGIDPAYTQELDWWQSTQIGNLEIHCTPSQHFSGRVVPMSNNTLWSSWAFKSDDFSFYFSGDSGYSSHFKEIYNKLGSFDLAFMENGQYNTLWKNIHLLPKETIKAFEDLQAKKLVSIHWGMFSLAPHSWYEPVERILPDIETKQINYLSPMLGQLVDGKNPVKMSYWWKKYMPKDVELNQE